MTKITARKYMGDDAGSWAIFVDGQSTPVVSGLTRSEVAYHKKLIAARLEAAINEDGNGEAMSTTPAGGDELLGHKQIAEMIGVQPDSVRGYRRHGLIPEPDDLSVPDRPRWRRSTIEAWIPTRRGMGAPGRPRKRTPVPEPATMEDMTLAQLRAAAKAAGVRGLQSARRAVVLAELRWHLIPGRRYRVEHRTRGQRANRISVLDCVAVVIQPRGSHDLDGLFFSNGVRFDRSEVVSFVEVPKSTPISMNGRA
jgi:hypothetical protein